MIDLQNDWFDDEELARGRDGVLKTCNQLIELAGRENAPVVEVQTVHARDRSTWALNMLDDGLGVVIEGTAGAQRLEGLLPSDHLVVKTRDSAFHRTDLEAWLREREV